MRKTIVVEILDKDGVRKCAKHWGFKSISG